MIVPESIGKALLRDVGIPVPAGVVARTSADVEACADTLGVRVAIKAQIPAGKRGKSGGIAFAATPPEARDAAKLLLGATISGHRVDTVLVERAIDVDRELYIAILNDADRAAPLVLFSQDGGVDIEELHARAPERIVRATLDIRRGLDLPTATAITGDERTARVLIAMYERFRTLDLSLLEINPLAVDADGRPVALDCKMTLDDSAIPRQAALAARIESATGPLGTALERRARTLGLYFIELDGDIGILANGAGLTMTTIDAVARQGGQPANFLEIGGDAYTKGTAALEIVLANPRVKSLLVNFCGAFARTDVMAEGVVAAIESLRPGVPIFFSIHGTNAERAVELVRARLGIEPHDLMSDAVRAAIAAARQDSTFEPRL